MATIQPVNYWRCDDGQPTTTKIKDFMNVSDMELNYIGSNNFQVINDVGKVGKFLRLPIGGLIWCNGACPITGSFTIEFMMRPARNWDTCILFGAIDGSIGTQLTPINGSENSIPVIMFNTQFGGQDNWSIKLDGAGRKSLAYLMDGNWHHIVFKYDHVAGTKEVWIDGQCPTGFSKSAPKGTSTGTKNIVFGNTTDYVGYRGDLDEMAIYNVALPGTHILEHYNNMMTGQHYNFNTLLTTVPAPDPVITTIDIKDYAPGHTSTMATYNGVTSRYTTGVNVMPIDQLKAFPVPRYKPGHTLLNLYNWMDISYLARNGQRANSNTTPPLFTYPLLDWPTVVQNSVTMTDELTKNWNYGIEGTGWKSDTASYTNANGTPNTSTMQGAIANFANQNPTIPVHTTVLRAQLGDDFGQDLPRIWAKDLPDTDYLRNSSGQFLDQNGNVTSNKTWSPAGNWQNFVNDGLKVRKGLLPAIAAMPNRPANKKIDFINENGEVFPQFYDEFTTDPALNAQKASMGLSWKKYIGRKIAENEINAYKNQFMNIPGLEQTKFTEYALAGQPYWCHDWDETKVINSQINGKYYSTSDFYPRWPHNWRMWITSWHGMQWFFESRNTEIASGDKLFSPFVAAGWSHDEEENIRPGQFLGLLKLLNVFGAEFFYSGYFNVLQPFQLPENWVSQAAIPAYAQAVVSRYEDVLRNGDIMRGDKPLKYAQTERGYDFYCGDMTKMIMVRKHSNGTKYVIAATQQPVTNNTGNVPAESVATIVLDGQTLKFKVRKQGSVYVYDKSNAAAPVFYQLDEWHESTHPYYWSKDFMLNAEVFDNNNASVVIKTEVPAGAVPGDFSNHTSYIGFNGATSVEYNFQPRATGNYSLWVKARSKNAAKTGFNVSLDSGSAIPVTCIVDTNWGWYRMNSSTSTPIVFNNLSEGKHKLTITSVDANVEIERIHLSLNNAASYTDATVNCGGTVPTPTITVSGSTIFCAGNSVVLTSSAANSYLWSNGATTQAISVTQSGSYSVTVTTPQGSATSSAVNVTVNQLPVATISANGPLTFEEGGSVTLTSSAGSSYLWSNGATTQSIIVTTTGSYTVRVTNSTGCSLLSNNTIVTVTPKAIATITAGGPTTFCAGSSVTLTANPGTSYVWSNGATTQSINVTMGGSYTVTVTTVNGTATSVPTVVTVVPLPAATITASGPLTFPQGNNVTLTASAGASYLWSNGATTQSIVVNTSGTFSVRVTNSSGCFANSSSVTTTVSQVPVATITASGPLAFCVGGSVTLTANQGTSYLWSNGATTQSIIVATSGNFTVAVTTAAGTATSNPAAVSVYPLPTSVITASGPLTFPQGGSVTLTASAAASYTWSNGAKTQSIVVTSSGTYTVAVANAQGCVKLSDPVVVTVTVPTGNNTETVIVTNPGSYLSSQGMTTMPNWDFTLNVPDNGTYYLFFRIKSRTGSSTNMNFAFDSASMVKTSYFSRTNTTWKWYKHSTSFWGTPKALSLTAGTHKLTFKPTNDKCDFIEFAVSKNPNFK